MSPIDAYAVAGFREPVSSFTHLLAVPVFAVLGYFLVRRGRGCRRCTVSLVILTGATVFLLSMSGVYHLLAPGVGRDVMRRLDMSGVFLLIAGTATPMHAILFRGVNRWAPLLFIWTAAVTGITLISIYAESLAPEAAIATFLVLGWGGLFSCVLLWRRYGMSFVEPFLWGGVAYTAGAIVLQLGRPALVPGVIGAHELWHLAVLVGLALHWRFVFQFASGPPERWAERHPAESTARR